MLQHFCLEIHRLHFAFSLLWLDDERLQHLYINPTGQWFINKIIALVMKKKLKKNLIYNFRTAQFQVFGLTASE